jgi:2-(1,2-epoxy-1,2-dihydrophenyl)acetyl-CoA isomerase
MSEVLVERRSDGVAIVTLNRPETLNAMSASLQRALAECLPDLADDRAVRCVVLTGAGRAFCAGGDVKSMADRAERAARGDVPSAAEFDESLRELRRNQYGSTYLLHTMPKPTIAMVNGVAVGAGMSLALACDLRIASDQARFGAAFRNVGLPGDFGGSYLLQRLVGMGKARELYFTAEIVDAEEALRLGMVNRVVPHERLEQETMELAARLAAGPTLAYARMKDNLTLAEHADLRTVLDQEALNMRLLGTSEDFREGASAFVEKRPPTFRGR